MCRLSWLPSPSLPALCAVFILSSLGSLSSCQLAESRTGKTVVIDSGTLTVEGVMQPSHISARALS